MRLSYLFLLVGATLTFESVISEADEGHVLDTYTNDRIEDNRFLRMQSVDKEVKDEDRFLNTKLNVEMLEDILTNTNGKMLQEFENWKTLYSSADITKRIRKYMPQDERYWGLGILYQDYLSTGNLPKIIHNRLDEAQLSRMKVFTDEELAQRPSAQKSGWLSWLLGN